MKQVEELKKHSKIQNINNNNIINNTINNTFVKFDKVYISNILSKNEIIEILNEQYLSIEKAVEKIHFNNMYPEYSNIFITNLKDTNAYVFNGINFITITKDEAMNTLITNYTEEIELSLDQYKLNLRPNIIKRLKRFIEQLNSDEKYIDTNNKSYSNYRLFKINNLKRLIYNKSDPKILNQLKKINLVDKLIENNAQNILL
jgi:hypothetical protein